MLLASIPALYDAAAIVPLALLSAALVALIAYETTIYGEARHRVRHPEQA